MLTEVLSSDTDVNETQSDFSGPPSGQSVGPEGVELIDWAHAKRIATKVAGEGQFAKSYHRASLEADLSELTALAEELVSAETGLVSVCGPARSAVVSREQWVQVNLATFKRQLEPIASGIARNVPGVFAPVAAKAAGTEIGALLGWMSKRVLGQYDLLVSNDNPDDGDVVYYVASNILAIEKRFGFPPREFRLWLALHEVTHRAQFTGVPWMREYYLSLIDATVGKIAGSTSPSHLSEAIARTVKEIKMGKNPIADAGLFALMMGNAQRDAMAKTGGLMSLLEGHGDIVMNRAGKGRIPSAQRFADTLSQRRGEAHGLQKMVRIALGLEAKMKQYEEGERFIEAVEASRGPRFIDQVWANFENLPNLDEIRDPNGWIARIESR